MKRTLLSLVAIALFAALPVHAQEEESAAGVSEKARTICQNIVPINEIAGAGVLYKPSNLHGGRGPSFLVQNVGERTNKRVLEIRNARCQVIATIGLYATDQPYGSRYYMRSGGTGQDADELLRLAMLVGSPNILIEGVNKWVRIKNPQNREGSVRK